MCNYDWKWLNVFVQQHVQTPLHLAAENDHSDVVKLFLKHRPELVTMANTVRLYCQFFSATCVFWLLYQPVLYNVSSISACSTVSENCISWHSSRFHILGAVSAEAYMVACINDFTSVIYRYTRPSSDYLWLQWNIYLHYVTPFNCLIALYRQLSRLC